MFLLDTDKLNLILRGDLNVARKVVNSPGQVWISTITVEETIGKEITHINTLRAKGKSINAPNEFLVKYIQLMSGFPVAPYSDAAEAVYRGYSASVKRIGAVDCRLAAHATVLGFVAVTRNTQDFQQIPQIANISWAS